MTIISELVPYNIKDIDGEVIYQAMVPESESEARKLGRAIQEAVRSGVRLFRANLEGADISYLNLGAGIFSDANLRNCNANYAWLGAASFDGADFTGSNLRHIIAPTVNFTRANFIEADLRHADCRASRFDYAIFENTRGGDLVIAETRILPEGDIIGWKKCQNGVIVKLKIPAEAKRSHAFGRKCRAEYADVLEVIGSDVGVSSYDFRTEYHPGKRVYPDRFDDNWQNECASGIHFFITREEAENY